jgi:hypothetical protein
VLIWKARELLFALSKRSQRKLHSFVMSSMHNAFRTSGTHMQRSKHREEGSAKKIGTGKNRREATWLRASMRRGESRTQLGPASPRVTNAVIREGPSKQQCRKQPVPVSIDANEKEIQYYARVYAQKRPRGSNCAFFAR